MYGHTYSKSMHQPGKVANPARGQLNRENEYSTLRRIWSSETGSAVPSRVSLHISTLRLDLVFLLTGFLPSSAAASIYLFEPPYAIGSVPSLSCHAIAYQWRLLPKVCRHRPINLKVVPNGCCLGRSPWTINMCLFFPHPLLV